MIKAALICLGLCALDLPSRANESPLILALPEDATCVDLANLANQFIDMGRDKAIAELERQSGDGFGDSRQLADRLCAILFSYQGDSHRRFLTGGFMMLPFLTMPVNDWPYYPLAESDGVFFILSSGELLAGFRFNLKYNFDTRGSKIVFRKDHLKIPSRQEATLALERLIGSDAWKRIKWKDEGKGSTYSYSEAFEIEILKKQISRQANQSKDPTP